MSAFLELRIYQVLPGKMEEWLTFMEDTIIPYHGYTWEFCNGQL